MYSEPRYPLLRIKCFEYHAQLYVFVGSTMYTSVICASLPVTDNEEVSGPNSTVWRKGVKVVCSFELSAGTNVATQPTWPESSSAMSWNLLPGVTDVSTRTFCRRLISRPWGSCAHGHLRSLHMVNRCIFVIEVIVPHVYVIVISEVVTSFQAFCLCFQASEVQTSTVWLSVDSWLKKN